MIKQFQSVIVERPQSTRRQSTIHEKAADPELGDWIDSKPVLVKIKGIIGSLHLLCVVVNLPGGDYRGAKYVALTHLKGGKVSFKSHLPDWKGIKKGVEVVIPGKEITLKGTINWAGVHIPVVIGKKTCQIPYQQIKFKKEQK